MPTGIGLIGCGARMSGVMQNTLGTDDAIEVRALCDPSPLAVSRCREACRCPAARLYADYRDLCRDPAIEWVGIGSWNALHKDHILGAIAAGKHVFTEKPLVTNLDDCVAVRQAVKGFHGIFSMGFVLRYASFYRRLRALIDEGVLGRLISFEFNETLGHDHGGYIMADWRRLRANAGTHLLEKCCHDIDLANWMTGSIPVRAASFGGLDLFRPEHAHLAQRLGADDRGRPAYRTWQGIGIYTSEQALDPFTSDKDIIDNQVVIWEYANGVRASFHTNLNNAITERRFYLCGSEGTIRGDVLSGHITWQRIGYQTERHEEDNVGGGHGGADPALAASLRASILTGAPPAVSWEEGVRAAVACFGADMALDRGEVVDLRPLWDRVGITP